MYVYECILCIDSIYLPLNDMAKINLQAPLKSSALIGL
jgi:hypothetical protein